MADQPRVLVIAEAGVNHNGSIATALSLVDAASEVGADVVKFQTFTAQGIARKDARKAAYQRRAGAQESQYEMLRRLEMDDRMHREVLDRCREQGIAFMSSAFDPAGLDYLISLGIDRVKVPSGEIDNLPYLRCVAEHSPREVLLSTGASTMAEVEAALEVLTSGGVSLTSIVVMQCTTQYPAPIREANIRAMVRMGALLGVRVGYSDHTPGSQAAAAATALGAVVLEKHFTLDRGDTLGPDHQASLDPAGFRAYVDTIRLVESSLGDGVKRVSESEAENRRVIRKSIVAARPIQRGEILTDENLGVKRPGDGLSPMRIDQLLGQRATRTYDTDEFIEEA